MKCPHCKKEVYTFKQKYSKAEPKLTEEEIDTMQTIIEMVSRVADVHPSDMKRQNRSQELVIPRHLFFWLVRKYHKYINPKKVGWFMGKRDRTTVLHGVQNIENKIFTRDYDSLPLILKADESYKNFIRVKMRVAV